MSTSGRQQGIARRAASLIMDSDTTPTRFMLGLMALSWAVGLALPGDTFDRPVYQYMKLFGMNEGSWFVLWSLHAIGMFWRIFSDRPAPRMALAINLLGLLLFTGAAMAIFSSRTYPFPAGIAPDVISALASFWVFVRTGINSNGGWRID